MFVNFMLLQCSSSSDIRAASGSTYDMAFPRTKQGVPQQRECRRPAHPEERLPTLCKTKTQPTHTTDSIQVGRGSQQDAASRTGGERGDFANCGEVLVTQMML